MGIPNLSVTANTTLGTKLFQATILFQSSSADLINAESKKLEFLCQAASQSQIQFTTLTLVNEEIKLTIIALSSLEGKINKKITAGTHLHNWW